MIINSERWTADILLGTENEAGFFSIYARTLADSRADALAGAEQVLNAFAFGRLAYIRVKPEANSEIDFDTKVTIHQGFVRFSYRLEAGEWQYPDPPMMLGFGSAA